MNVRTAALIALPFVALPALADEPAPTPAPAELDFDFFGPKEAPKVEANPKRDREIHQRRAMLTLHQGLGLATYGALGGAVVLGQLQLLDKYPPGFGDTGVYFAPHLALALTATALFTTTGLLGFLAPTPFKKPFVLDTVGFHRVFMVMAAAGMFAQLLLGIIAGALEGSLLQRSFAHVHQVIGYSTLAAMSLGSVSLVF